MKKIIIKITTFLLIMISTQISAKGSDLISYLEFITKENFYYKNINYEKDYNMAILENIFIQSGILKKTKINRAWISYDKDKKRLPYKGKIILEKVLIPTSVLNNNFSYILNLLKKRNQHYILSDFSLNYELYQDNLNMKFIINSKNFNIAQIDINLKVSNKIKNLFEAKTIKETNIEEVFLNEKFKSLHVVLYDKDIFRIFIEESLKKDWIQYYPILYNSIEKNELLSKEDKIKLIDFIKGNTKKIDTTIYIPNNSNFKISNKDFLERFKYSNPLNFIGKGIFWNIY